MSLRETVESSGHNAEPLADTKVLVVEDDPGFRIAIEAALEDAGCELLIIDDGNETLRSLYSFRPELVLLDIRLPGVNGLDLCSSIRTMSDVPTIIFSALHDTGEKLIAFERGADDYVVKDTPMEELIARIAVALRHAGPSTAAEPDEGYADSCVEIDFTRFSVRVRGVEVDLTPTEYKILTLLVKRAGEPVPPQQLLRRVWGPEYNSEDLVKWHVGHLRRKIELNPENRSSSSHAVASDTFTPDRPLSPSLTQMPALLAITIFGLFVGAISNLAIERTPPIEGLVPPSLRNGVSLRVQFRRVVVTVLAALLFALAWSRFGDSPIEFAAVAAFGTVFLVLAFVDLETLYLPDVIIYPAFIVALAVLPFRSDLAIWQGALGAVVGLAVFFPFAWIGDRIGRDIMGWGDVKFSALLGIVLGIQLLLLGLYLGILIGGVVGIGALLARGLGARRTLIPYGPSLAVGGLIALYAGSAITDWASRTL